MQIKETVKATRQWPLWGESTGDRWIPLTKGQKRRKCFHLMTVFIIVEFIISQRQHHLLLILWCIRLLLFTNLAQIVKITRNCETKWSQACINWYRLILLDVMSIVDHRRDSVLLNRPCITLWPTISWLQHFNVMQRAYGPIQRATLWIWKLSS